MFVMRQYASCPSALTGSLSVHIYHVYTCPVIMGPTYLGSIITTLHPVYSPMECRNYQCCEHRNNQEYYCFMKPNVSATLLVCFDDFIYLHRLGEKPTNYEYTHLVLWAGESSGTCSRTGSTFPSLCTKSDTYTALTASKSKLFLENVY